MTEGEKVIHEIKKSNKADKKLMNGKLKYYMYVCLNDMALICGWWRPGISALAQDIVLLSDVDREEIQEITKDISNIISQETCPPRVKKGILKIAASSILLHICVVGRNTAMPF